jgi:hypothetical protein
VNQVANLNTGQQKAADDFSAFMFSDQKEFVITGGPEPQRFLKTSPAGPP